jgi:hypothetical protein
MLTHNMGLMSFWCQLIIGAAFVSLTASSAYAVSYTVDISKLAGFQQSGVGGTAGNGIVFAGPVYAFMPGDIVNFGTAIVSPDPPDGRGGPCPPNCFGNAGRGVYFLRNGVGGLALGSFELFDATGHFSVDLDFVDCAPLSTCQIAYSLLFTLGPTTSGIQLAFQGSSLAIIPPGPPVPLPPALSLFAAGLGILGLLAARRKLSGLA